MEEVVSSISPKRSIKSSLPQSSQLMSVVNGGDSAVSSSPERKRLKASAKKGTLTVNRGGSKMKPSSSMTNLVQTTDSVGKSGI